MKLQTSFDSSGHSNGTLWDSDKDKKMGEGANVEVVREVLSTVKPVGIPEWHVRGDRELKLIVVPF